MTDQENEMSGASGQPSSQSGDDGEWADIARQIERLLRRDVARLVGAQSSDDWGAIKDSLLGRVKSPAEAFDRSEVTRRVEDVGRQVEERVRTGLAGAVGAGQESDWTGISRTLRERVETLLDPERRRSPGGTYPGGSGTGASPEDASVPAAPPSPDRPPTPAGAGGEDTGLPTVTEDVGDLPGPPPGGTRGDSPPSR